MAMAPRQHQERALHPTARPSCRHCCPTTRTQPARAKWRASCAASRAGLVFNHKVWPLVSRRQHGCVSHLTAVVTNQTGSLPPARIGAISPCVVATPDPESFSRAQMAFRGDKVEVRDPFRTARFCPRFNQLFDSKPLVLLRSKRITQGFSAFLKQRSSEPKSSPALFSSCSLTPLFPPFIWTFVCRGCSQRVSDHTTERSQPSYPRDKCPCVTRSLRCIHGRAHNRKTRLSKRSLVHAPRRSSVRPSALRSFPLSRIARASE